MTASIDFIGDIHGHCDELRALLEKLGYVERGGAFRYPGDARKVVFLGDYVDRGPKILETLRLVRAMRDAGSAVALMGNHEFNMLAYHHRNGDGWRRLGRMGDYLRDHSEKNVSVHAKTVAEFARHPGELLETLEFLKTLQFYLETESFRAVHACFDFGAISALKRAGIKSFNDGNFAELVHRANDEFNELGDSLFDPFDIALKGPEADLPEGGFFYDKDGNMRTARRIDWWSDPSRYGKDERPVFFGHYWFKGEPKLTSPNVCCLDYSVAKPEQDGGRLACYRFDGEPKLDAAKLVWVERKA